MIQRANEQNGRICIYRVSDSGPKRLLFVPWQYGISLFAPTGPRCAHPSANTLCSFYRHTNEVLWLQCYLDAYERLVLIGFRFIWSVRTCPLTFPLAWQAVRPSCLYTQASWSVATGHIKNQGYRTRQAGRQKEEESVAMPMRKTEKSPQLFRLPLNASEWSESDLLVKMKLSPVNQSALNKS